MYENSYVEKYIIIIILILLYYYYYINYYYFHKIEEPQWKAELSIFFRFDVLEKRVKTQV